MKECVLAGKTKENTCEGGKEGGRSSGPEIPGDFCPDDGSSGPKKIKSKQVLCQQLGTGSTRTDRVVPRKAWKFYPGRGGRERTQGDSWYGGI